MPYFSVPPLLRVLPLSPSSPLTLARKTVCESDCDDRASVAAAKRQGDARRQRIARPDHKPETEVERRRGLTRVGIISKACPGRPNQGQRGAVASQPRDANVRARADARGLSGSRVPHAYCGTDMQPVVEADRLACPDRKAAAKHADVILDNVHPRGRRREQAIASVA
jgi:hypothetical protein